MMVITNLPAPNFSNLAVESSTINFLCSYGGRIHYNTATRSNQRWIHNNKKMQTQSPNCMGSSFIFPVHGDVYPNGFFYVSVNIGNPPKTYHLDIDTGSDLTWVQCEVPANLHKPHHNPYKPKYNVVCCKDPLCASVNQPPDHPCRIPDDRCHYVVEYADHSSSLGVLVRDYFTFNEAANRHILAFGCGYHQKNSDPSLPVDGVFGLADGKSSLLRQLHSLNLTRNVIGHCFSRRGGGFLFFGDGLVPSGIVWTPMETNPLNHYLSGPVDLLLGEQTLVAENLDIVFDSGSTYTYLNSHTYINTLSKIMTEIKTKPLQAVDDELPVCWKGVKPFRSIEAVKNYFSPLALRFRNNVRFALPPENYLIVTSRGNVCMGILNAGEINLEHPNIIGDISMLDKVVVYDNERRMIGWASSNCDRRF
ncbi:aspartic proteinase Asp1-like [Cornus florida]|uniref:aspartic proteinase Asp1-like n=1 Tax=Cornus florida TaxID=4283 RepID=UPI00289FEFBB|nr:aspartic proteinase Asp1-like [Cornus florida]XP_059630720.1 aspartic proteinase Asp1-like [Cornus florida]